MLSDSSASADRKPTARSKTTNNRLALAGVDGRTLWGRRRRDLIGQLCNELGREPSTSESATISNVASLQVRLEQLQITIMRGEPVDDAELIRFSGLVARLLTTLEPHKSSTPSLDEYLAQRGAAA